MSAELLTQELETLAWCERLMEEVQGKIPRDDFEKLHKSYKRLLKDFNRIIRISDRNELRLQNLSEELTKEKAKLEGLANQLSSYLPRQVFESIFAGKQTLEIKTKRRLLTVFFSDIQGFTKISEALQPEKLTHYLNQYFSEMSRIALKHGGTIDKFIGDAMMVFFGDPETRGDRADALAAVSMAVEMQERLAELNLAWQAEGLQYPFITRMGLNTGYCNVGNFGSAERMAYTIIGGEVNLTARIESACEAGGVLLSYETYSLVQDHMLAVEREPLTLKGIGRPVRTFAIKNFYGQATHTGEDLPIKLELPGAKESLEIHPSKLSLPERIALVASLRSIASQLEGASDAAPN
ncbi:CyaA Adenylate cyclase, family 3 (some proteins contain HAMP domain) [Burkholderiales bacterium]